MRFSLFLIGAGITLSITAAAQQKNTPLNRSASKWMERYLSDHTQLNHTAFRPLVESQIKLDSLKQEENKRWQRKEYKSWLGSKTRNESLIVIKDEKTASGITIDPLFHQEIGQENELLYRNTRGIRVQGDLGKKLSFSTSFYETQAHFPSWVDSFATSYAETAWVNDKQVYYSNFGFGLIPGQGRAKPFKKRGYDFGMASGYVSYSPSKRFNFQAGHGKHFIGEGYRSLLLSDNAFNYPYLRMTSTWLKGRIQYTNLYTSFQSLNRIPFATTPEAPFERKAGSFNYINFAPFNRVHIGLFEGTIWQKWDSARTVPFDWNYVNPLIGVNTLINGYNGKNNTVLGANLKLSLTKRIDFYSLYVFDDDAEYGYQVGFKLFDVFGVNNLDMLTEYNTVSAYTYGHDLPLQNYSHYNQALAHPWGAGFKEWVSFISYKWKDIAISWQYTYGTYEDDEAQYHWGKDIFKPDNQKTVFQIVPNEVTYMLNHVKASYLINPNTNMRIEAGGMLRNTNNTQITDNDLYFYVTWKTALTNHYYDF